MKIDTQITYAADPTTVAAMTADRGFQELKCAATGALSYSVDISHSGERTVITTTRMMPTDGFPDFAKSIVGDKLEVVEVDDWGPADGSGNRDGTISVTIANAPLKFTGVLRLAATDGGSAANIDGDLKAAIPLFGSKIEKAAAPAIVAAVRAEEKTAATWLAEH